MSSSSNPTLTCDDGDPCTYDDVEEVAECDNDIVCTPCAGEPNPSCINTIMRQCDDGDPCTVEDMEEVDDCDNDIVCVPCAGVPIECGEDAFCETTVPCDDGDPCTIDDEETYLNSDGTICEPCAGIPTDCNNGDTLEQPCDDGDPNTIDDVETILLCDGSVCIPCAGVPTDCQSFPTYTISCDDGDPCTIDDEITLLSSDSVTVCEPCAGVPTNCNNGNTTEQPCDDGNPLTINDVETILDCDGSVCIPCMGTLSDCTTGSTSVVPCDDGDPCTSNDEQTVLDSTGIICVPCEGIPLVCGDSSLCEQVRPCDDNDDCTINDMETILLRDSSICEPCTGDPITPMVNIDSVVCSDDLLTYNVYLQSNFALVTNDQNAPVTDQGNDYYLITDLDTSSQVTITVTYPGTSCNMDVVVQAPDCNCLAYSDAGPDQFQDCYNGGTVMIGSQNSSQGPRFEYVWYDLMGMEVGYDAIIQVTESGMYTLVVTDLLQNCSNSSSVSVVDQRNEPIAIILADPDSIIDCFVQSVTLSGLDQPNAIYQWSTSTGMLNGIDVSVNIGGTVTLTVIDTITGCQNASSIQIVEQEDYPLIFFESPEVLTCQQMNVTISLASTASQGTSFIHQWYDINEMPIQGGNGTDLNVASEGQYIIETTDTTNNCTNRDTIEVIGNYEEPVIDAGSPENLTLRPVSYTTEWVSPESIAVHLTMDNNQWADRKWCDLTVTNSL